MHDAGDRNQRILFLRPGRTPEPENFGTDTTAVPTPGPGQFLSRTIYLSLEPHYWGAVRAAPDAGLRLNPGDVMTGETVAQVVESRHPEYRSGEFIVVRNGWQQFALSSGQGVRRLDPERAPISTALGVLGLPGLTGYVGLLYLGEPRPSQTVLVTSATGPVGCTVGQTARLVGARAVGFAGTAAKCDYAVHELGFAACINHRDGDLAGQIRAACPDGVDVFFDTRGGETLSTVLDCLAPHARIVLSGFNGAAAGTHGASPAGPALGPIVTARATLRGILVEDHLQRIPELQKVVGGWIRAGVFRYREDITEGLSEAPRAFAKLLRGEHFGKVLVRVAPEHL
jgi:NADPH-dependent curcumin reductase CurA